MTLNVSRQFLVELFLHPDLATGLSEQDWTRIILVLRREQLLARFGLVFKQQGILDELSSSVGRHFSNAIKMADYQHNQIRYEAIQLNRYLTGKCENLVYLKGASYVLSDVKASLGRVCGDIDVIVKVKDLKNVENALLLSGWVHQELTEYDDQYYRKWAHEIPPLRHGIRGTILDLHHNIVPIISGRHIDTDYLFEQVITIENGSKVLSEPAQFVHSCIHLFFNEDHKYAFRDMFDLFLLADGKNRNFWEEVTKISGVLKFSQEVYWAQRYLHLIFDLAIPCLENERKQKTVSCTERGRDFFFLRALSPKHIYSKQFGQNFALFVLNIRGHFLKMPFRVLASHLLVKTYRLSIEKLFGKHVFTESNQIAERDVVDGKGNHK